MDHIPFHLKQNIEIKRQTKDFLIHTTLPSFGNLSTVLDLITASKDCCVNRSLPTLGNLSAIFNLVAASNVCSWIFLLEVVTCKCLIIYIRAGIDRAMV